MLSPIPQRLLIQIVLDLVQIPYNVPSHQDIQLFAKIKPIFREGFRIKLFKTVILNDHQNYGGTSFVDHLCYLCLLFGMLSRLFIAAVWSPAGKGLTSRLSFVMLNCFCHLPMWYPASGVVLDSYIPELCHLSYLDGVLHLLF